MNQHTALLLVDVQTGLDNPDWGQRNNPDAESRMSALLRHWREHDWPVIHIQHCSTNPDSPLRPNQPGVSIKPEVEPEGDEPVLQKQVNSAFIGTPLETLLKERGCSTLVVVGLTTDHCVSTTVRMAANMGFKVFLVEDATATFDRTGPDGTYFSADVMHSVNLASLNGEFCEVVSSGDVIDHQVS